MNILSKFMVVLFGVLFFAITAEASTIRMYICDGCTTNQYKIKAKSNAPANELSYAYVLDTTAGLVTKFRVFSETESGITFTNAAQISVDSTMTQKFDEYMTVLDVARAPFIIYPWQDTSGPFESAYELIGNPDGLNDLYDVFRSQYNVFEWDIAYFSMLAYELSNKLTSFVVTVEFRFEDGTTLVVKVIDWNWTNQTFRFEYHYAEDVNGDIIPLEPADYTPDEPIGSGVSDYFGNNGYISVDPFGIPFDAWTWGECYGISCSDEGPTKVCIVVVIANSVCAP